MLAKNVGCLRKPDSLAMNPTIFREAKNWFVTLRSLLFLILFSNLPFVARWDICVNSIGHFGHFRSFCGQNSDPFSAQFRPASDGFGPDDMKVRSRAKVLCYSDSSGHIHHNMPNTLKIIWILKCRKTWMKLFYATYAYVFLNTYTVCDIPKKNPKVLI